MSSVSQDYDIVLENISRSMRRDNQSNNTGV